MAEIFVPRPARQLPHGTDLTLVNGDGDSDIVAQFGASVLKGNLSPGGEMHMILLVPFDQVPNTMGVLREVGGVMFEVTCRRVPMDELPDAGEWE